MTEAYEDSLKSPTSVIIPTPALEREDEKYNNNNNNTNNINNNLSNSSSNNNVSLKIEEVSNETSNLMIEDRQNASATTRWRFDLFSNFL